MLRGCEGRRDGVADDPLAALLDKSPDVNERLNPTIHASVNKVVNAAHRHFASDCCPGSEPIRLLCGAAITGVYRAIPRLAQTMQNDSVIGSEGAGCGIHRTAAHLLKYPPTAFDFLSEMIRWQAQPRDMTCPVAADKHASGQQLL